MASETAKIQADFDKRLEEVLGRAKSEAVMAYRRDRGRAVEQMTAYVEGGIYILDKIKEAFPDQDWTQLPAPVLPPDEGMVDDEHSAILKEIDEEGTGASSQPEQQQQ